MSEIKLLRCPFCDRAAVSVAGARANYVICNVCGAETALYDTEEEAINAWNKREAHDYVLEQLKEQIEEHELAEHLMREDGVHWLADKEKEIAEAYRYAIEIIEEGCGYDE